MGKRDLEISPEVKNSIKPEFSQILQEKAEKAYMTGHSDELLAELANSKIKEVLDTIKDHT